MSPIDVTVVIPSFNSESTIYRAVASIAAQSLLPKRVIIVDDFSADQKLIQNEFQRILDDFGDKFSLSLELQAINGGPAKARNHGWNLAQSRYIAFLDADDSWHPQKLEIQYGAMERHPGYALTGHGYAVVDPATPPANLTYSGAQDPRLVTSRELLLRNWFCTPGVMLRRELTTRFSEKKRRSEDYLLWLEIAFSGNKVGFIDLPLARLYKAAYGSGGLSSAFFRSEMEEIDTYFELRRKRFVSIRTLLAVVTWSIIKFVRRLCTTGLGNCMGITRQRAHGNDI